MILYRGDCLEELSNIPDNSIDMVMTDPPYGKTQCRWDSVIPLGPLWRQLKRVVKVDGAIVVTASQPFTSIFISGNLRMFKYCWVWEKSKATGHLNSKKRPLVKHEDIMVFYDKQPTYKPQGLIEKKVATISKGDRGRKGRGSSGDCYNEATKDAIQTHTNYPLSVLNFNVDMKAKFHPNQKPVTLMEYLIKTYTNKGDTVLDFAMGSGTTGVACKNIGRNFIGIELDQVYFSCAAKRLDYLNS